MKKGDFVGIIVWIVMIITFFFFFLCLMISKWLFEAIYNSDMPTWLKYILLK